MVALVVVDKLKEIGVMDMPHEAMIRSLGDFKGLPHRLEDIGEYSGIRFYNDSISTIPEAALKAVESVEKLGTLIIGGFDRKIDYRELADFLDGHDELNIICLPITGHKVRDLMVDKDRCFLAADMEEAVAEAYRITKPGQACLLSPAASSYNQYRNFEERGDHFVECVRKYEADK